MSILSGPQTPSDDREVYLSPEALEEVARLDLLKTLLRGARDALKREDAELHGIFRRADPAHRTSYEGVSRGLGYHLFEANLVYTIFKSWLPVVPVEWEARYDHAELSHIDLLAQPLGPGRRLRWGFEARWWHRSDKRGMGLFHEDARRLLADRKLDERFLLAFWISESAHWARDRREIAEACLRPQIPHHPEARITPFYLAAFHTEVAHGAGAPHYFALAALRLTPA